ncbi:GNAT family N-acetyltransferase [Cryobacterium sp. Y11]|jgi:ribosomal protein S18 acetylase RimI-like enzyme|uniref:GNAT family N-acetyltransferase n=1 Tax=Cryobacterium sp. Y11 TaxID=2045016 RepID=UPI000CE3930F|nr:GNAT family N-acetyltransferase [Cryobacterium sp. Y11]
MPQFHAVSVADAHALTLLTEYFSSPELSFRQSQGAYQPTFPLAEQFVAPQGVFLVVLDPASGEDAAGRRYIGCGGIRRLDGINLERAENEPVRFEVKHLWMQPRARGRGWGRLLLAELEQRAASWGAAEVVLDTNKSLAAAGALYASTGYTKIEAYNDNPNATHWYRKRLGTN